MKKKTIKIVIALILFIFAMVVKFENELKRKVKSLTGFKMKDIEIEAFGDHFIEFSYYKTNYNRVTNVKSFAICEI